MFLKITRNVSIVLIVFFSFTSAACCIPVKAIDVSLRPLNAKNNGYAYSGARILGINEEILDKSYLIHFSSGVDWTLSCIEAEELNYNCQRYNYIIDSRLFPQFDASVDDLQARYGADLKKINEAMPKYCGTNAVSKILPYTDPKMASVRPIYENLVKVLQNSPRVKFIRKYLTDEEIQNTLDLVKNEPSGSEIVHWNNKFTGME